MARKTYYNITGTPTVKADGIVAAGATQASYTTAYNTRNAIDSPVNISMQVTVGAAINVAIQVTSTAAFTGTGLKFHTALIARDIDTTGSYSQTNYQWVMLDMAPTASGQTFNIAPGQTVNLNASFPIPTWLSLAEMAVVGFVQNDATKEILNAKYGQIPLTFPSLSLLDYDIIDNIGGTPNQIPEAGETCHLIVTLGNVPPFATATGVSVQLSSTDPDVIVIDGQSNIANIPPNGSASNQTDPFVFEISETVESHFTTLHVTVTADGGYTNSYDIETLIGFPQILLVDDDGTASYQTYFKGDLETLNYGYWVWTTNTQGAPTAAYLSGFDVVIWHTGMMTSTLNTAEQTAVAGYLDGGGKLFMSSENLGDELGSTTFYQNYFHATTLNNHVTTTTLAGVAGNPVSAGTNLLLLGGAYWPDQQSSINVTAPATALYKYNNAGQEPGALNYSDGYALVYFAFPYECLAPNPTSATPRATVLGNILEWFDTFSPQPDVTIDVVPHNPPITIPAAGGSFQWDLIIHNAGTTVVPFDMWINATLPNGSTYPVLSRMNLQINPGQTISRFNLVQNIPGSAPAGTYSYNGYIGDFQTVILHQDSFPFTKSAGVMGSGGNWNISNWDEGFAESSILPDKTHIAGASPNPFNPEAEISYEIASPGHASLTVFDISGRQVTSLVDGYLSAGQYKAVFNGSALPSGIYFVRLETNDCVNVQKVILMK